MCIFDLFDDIFGEEEAPPKNRRVKLNPTLREAYISELIKKQKGRCMYCGRKVSRDLFDLDHKNPVDRGGTNRKNNFQLLCRTCNTRKGAMTDREFRRKYKDAGVPQTQVLPRSVIRQNKFTQIGKTPSKNTTTRKKTATRRSASRTRTVHAADLWDGSPACGGRGQVAGLFDEVTCRKCNSAMW